MGWNPPVRVGDTWAYREKINAMGSLLIPAEVLRLGPKRSNKARVRFLDGELSGLDQWVPTLRLRAPWEQAEAFLHDEQAMDRASNASRDAYENAEYEAAERIFDLYREYGNISFNYRWPERATVCIPDLATVAADLGLNADDLLDEPLAFVNRFGEYIAPFSMAFTLARRIATVHTDEIVARLRTQEREQQGEAIHGDPKYPSLPLEYFAERLREEQPIYELVRRWCGREAAERFDELEALRTEVTRLRGLVERAVARLESAGERYAARQLRGEIDPASVAAPRRAKAARSQM